MSEGIADVIDAAWNDHATDSRGVAARLTAARPLLEREPAQVGAFMWLAEHLLLAHLADPDAMEPWIAVAGPLVAQQPDAAPALERARLATRLLRGAELKPGEQTPAVQVRALGTLANGLGMRGDGAAARRLLDQAAALARAPGAGPDALKGLAAAYHNVASHLIDGVRDVQLDGLMMDAARGSRDTWREAGTWLNVERGEYQLALCAAAIGDSAQAVAHARACLAICEQNDADAYERFFGHEVLGRALVASGDRAAAREQLAAMHSLLDSIAAADRAYPQSAFDKLTRDSDD